MKRFIAVALITTSSLALAQSRGEELDKAIEETRAAYLALQEAEKRRDAGAESQPGERLGTVSGKAGGPGGKTGGGPGGKAGGGPGGKDGAARGGSRQSDEYWERQEQLEREVERARQRYEAAQKRWGDLK